MSERWEAILDEQLAALPPGFAWPRTRDSLLAALLEPMARGLADFYDAAEALLAEVNPRQAIWLLSDYEDALGPDPCRPGGFATALTDRQRLAHARWTEQGGADVPYFIGLAAARGAEVSIEEFAPYRAGESECGESWSTPEEWRYPEGALLATEDGALIVAEDGAPIATGPLILLPPRWQVGAPAMMDYWRVAFGPRAIDWARASEAETGLTPHCIYDAEDEVECVVRRRRPAHTIPVFDYTAHAWQAPQPLRGAHA